MLKKLSSIFTKIFNKDLSFRVRVFNVIGLTGVFLSILSAVNAVMSKNLILVIASLVAAVVAVIMMYIFTFTRFRLPIKIITVTVVFCTIFPLMFFEIGDYGMMLFILGVLFSSVLFERKKNAVLICIALMFYYSGFIVMNHFPPFYYEDPNFPEIRMQLMTFILVSGAVAITVIWLVDAYETQAAELKVLNDNKVEFLSNFSHELKTPLTSISGFAQLGEQISLTGDPSSEKDVKQIQTSFMRIHRAAEHLKRMSKQLLEVTMIEQGVINVSLAPCVFAHVAEQIKGQFEAANENRGNELTAVSADNLPIINADPDKLIQVLFNLVKNADRHTEQGRITISAKAEADRVLIYVSDTGKGIPNELIPFLFKKYPQTEIGGIKTDHGMGLYICKTFVTAMGGEISLVKTSETGSEFLISLPVI
ncbi:MAG: HAMP domain-containing histidine kinase [Ruminococcus sp.]|jgi:signal transduction histidine kinase|nr:HAMP domain-containing histidine kinase [Ruminococcus sp.]